MLYIRKRQKSRVEKLREVSYPNAVNQRILIVKPDNCT